MPASINTFNTALSGLNAASTRLTTAATNIANQNTTSQRTEKGEVIQSPFQPQETVQSSLATGGVQASVRPNTSEPLKVFSPDNPEADENGFIELPNVDLAEQIVQTKIATYDYKANLNVIKAQDKLDEYTLDILA